MVAMLWSLEVRVDASREAYLGELEKGKRAGRRVNDGHFMTFGLESIEADDHEGVLLSIVIL